MTQDFKQAESSSTPWLQPLERLLAAGRRSDALRMLERIIEDAMPLFGADPVIRQERRLAWLYRIQILRELGRLSEALAWTCLECEMNPENVAAQALRERLKHTLNLSTRTGPPTGSRIRRATSEDQWPGVAGMREIKAILERDGILPLQEPELYQRYRFSSIGRE